MGINSCLCLLKMKRDEGMSGVEYINSRWLFSMKNFQLGKMDCWI